MKKICLVLFFFFSVFISRGQYWIQTGGSSTIDEGMDIASDGNNNTYTAGYFTSTLSMDGFNITSAGLADIFIVKTNSIGNIQWTKKAGGANIDKALSIDADASGNFVITGFFYASADFDGQSITSSGQQDMFVAKYDSSGTLLWVRKAGGTGGDIGNSVAFDNSGNIIVTGEFSNTCSFGSTNLTSLNGTIDVFTAKYGINGNLLWAKKGSGIYTDRGTDVSTDTNGNIYVAGSFSDTITFDNVHNNTMHNALFLIKYNSAGNEQWFRWLGSVSVNAIGGMAVGNNRINLTGDFSGTLYLFGNTGNPTLNGTHPNNIFIVRYNLQGNLIWTHADGSESEVTADAITVKNTGEVLIAGNFKCRFSDFSASYGTGIFCSIGYWDTYLAGYDNSGNRQWARHFGGRQDDYVYGISVFNDSLISVTGSFNENYISTVNPAAFLPHGAYTFYNTQTGTYCSDNSYENYISYSTNGNSDIYINSNVDLSREPLDFFQRSGIVCDRPFIEICIIQQGSLNCVDSIFACGDDSLEIKLYQADSIGPVFYYLWNTFSFANTIYVNTSGYYNISVTSADGCFSNNDTVYFFTDSLPDIPLISDSKGINVNVLNTISIQLCQPDSVQLTCTNVGGNTVQWSGFPPGQNPVWVSTEDIYIVTLTNASGCTTSNFIQVFSDAILPIPPVIPKLICVEDTIDNNDSLEVCLGDAFHFYVYDSISNPQGNMNGGFPVLFAVEWDMAPIGILSYSTQTFDNKDVFITTQTGDYDFLLNVSVIMGNVCHFDTVYVEKLIHVTIHPAPSGFLNVSITGPSDICPGVPTMLVATPDTVNFLWSTSETNDTIYVTQPGTYSVSAFETVTNSFGCSGSYTGFASHSLTGYDQPFVYIPSNGVICPGDSLELICTGTGTFDWQGPNGYAGNQWSIFVSIPGFYYCVETVAPGCDLVSNTIEVLEYSTPFLEAFPNDTICYNDSILLTVIAGPGSFIQWQVPLTGNSSTQYVSTPGTYFCDVTSCGITTTLTYTVLQYPAPVIPVISYVSPNLVSTLSFGYQWYLNGIPINGATSQTYAPLQNGSYTVEITDSNGCTAMSLPYTFSVGIPEFYHHDISISPNPANSSIQIELTSENFVEGKTILRIKNILGEELLKINSHRKEIIDLSNFSNGFYFVEVTSKNKILKGKIVVNH